VIALGVKVRDVITGFEGVTYGRCEYLTGCTQFCVLPPVDKDGKKREAEWFDEQRLEVLDADWIQPLRFSGERHAPAPVTGGPSTERMPSP
jgi:hypothetical protein